jgi:hypothetical protein
VLLRRESLQKKKKKKEIKQNGGIERNNARTQSRRLLQSFGQSSAEYFSLPSLGERFPLSPRTPSVKMKKKISKKTKRKKKKKRKEGS